MSDQDIFDEDLIKELGLDPETLNGPKAEKPTKTQAAKKDAVSGPAPSQSAVPPKQASHSPAPSASVQKAESTPKSKGTSPQPVTEETLEEKVSRVSHDIPVQLAAVLSKKTMTLKDVLELKTGELVEFKKLPHELVDLVANGKLVAKAELVLIDGKVGAKIVKLIK